MARDPTRLGLQGWIDTAIVAVLRLIQLASIVALFAISVVGFTLIGKAVYHYKEKSAAKGDHTSAMMLKTESHADPVVAETIHIAFEGLEFLLLAPLSFLILRSLGEYVEDLLMKDLRRRSMVDRIKAGESATQDEILESLIENEVLSIGKEGLLETKALTVALLFGIVATNVVSRVIDPKSATPLHEQIIGLILMVVLAAIYIAIELLGHTLKKRQPVETLRKPRPKF